MRQVTKYTAAIKDSVLSKVLASNRPSVITLAKEFNIPTATIYTWIYKMNKKGIKREAPQQRPKDQSATSKFQAVMDTIDKTEQEQSAYCRSQGIYSSHIETWKQQMLEGLGASSCSSTKESKAATRQMQDELKQLKSDLNRKDKALAELTALLVLKKKADYLWGDSEDD